MKIEQLNHFFCPSYLENHFFHLIGLINLHFTLIVIAIYQNNLENLFHTDQSFYQHMIFLQFLVNGKIVKALPGSAVGHSLLFHF